MLVDTEFGQIAALAEASASDYSKSVFGSYIGIDGTSIWAAATSAGASLHVHLLSCMLARIFEPAEPISIWVELVKDRREQIVKSFEDGEPVPFPLADASAQQDITRPQLAEWDASIRAWLRAADKVKEREQTQLLLILENIHLPVNSKAAVFASVIDAWKSALETMELLVSGMPQAVSNGAAMVGLSAWHLYPDMTVFGSKTVEVKMKDKLVKTGGVLSFGLSHCPRNSTSGVYWSLSLAHMRHYGRPISSVRRLDADPGNISFPQLRVAALGAILGRWRVPSDQTTRWMEILRKIGELLRENRQNRLIDRCVDTLVNGAAYFLEAQGEQRDVAARLVNLGRKRGADFIPGGNSPWPFFGLLEVDILLASLKGPEERIMLLRRLAAQIPEFVGVLTLIRCLNDYSEMSGLEAHVADSGSTGQEQSPLHDEPIRNDGDSTGEGLSNELFNGDLPQRQFSDGEPSKIPQHPEAGSSYMDSPFIDGTHLLYVTALPGFPAFVDTEWTGSISHHRWACSPGIGRDVLHANNLFGSTSMSIHSGGTELEFLLGNAALAAIYASRNHTGAKNIAQPYPMSFSPEDLNWCLENHLVSPTLLIRQIKENDDEVYRTLALLEFAASVYRHIPDANIAVKVLPRPLVTAHLGNALWKGGMYDGRRQAGDLLNALWLISYFEGCHDLERSQLKDAMAICVADSIYFPELVSILFASTSRS